MANVTNPAKPKSDEMFQNRGNQSGTATNPQGLVDAAKDVASNAAQSVKSAAESATKYVGEAGTYVGQRAEDATHSVGHGLRSAGESVRGMAPENEYIKGAADSVASSLDSAGKYLEDGGLSGIADDMTKVIKRNPIGALLVGVGIGFLLGRTMASSRSNY